VICAKRRERYRLDSVERFLLALQVRANRQARRLANLEGERQKRRDYYVKNREQINKQRREYKARIKANKNMKK
jgi:hypothetical protein